MADGSADLKAEFSVRWWLANSLTATVGGVSGGSLQNTYSEDSQYLVLSEIFVFGTPFDYIFDFTGIPPDYHPPPHDTMHDMVIRFKGRYAGSAAHNIRVMAWNFVSLSWEYLTSHADDIPSSGSDANYAWDANNPDWYSDGEFRLRIIHQPGIGNPAHLLWIDYLWLDDSVHSEFIPAEFRLRQENLDLHAEFLVRYGCENLSAEFTVRQATSSSLEGRGIIRHSAELDLDAHFYVERTWKELFAKALVMGASSRGLKAVAAIRQEASTDLLAEFVVKQSAADLKGVAEIVPNIDLFASFIINQSNASAILKGEFLVPMRYEDLPAEFILRQLTSGLHAEFRIRGINDMYSLIGYNMPQLLNHLENIGRGFVGSPYEFSPDMVWAGSLSAKLSSVAAAAQFKEITFGWRREPSFDYPSCLLGRSYEELILEDWDWTEQDYITSITRDTYIRLHFNRKFAESGWTYGDLNYGSETKLRCSYFDYLYPGESWTLGDRYHLDDEEIFIKFNIGTPDLTRLGFARLELYRYAGQSGARVGLELRRIAECDETNLQWTRWNPANKIGTCNYPPIKNNIWSQTALKWENCGRDNLQMGGPTYYFGLSSFVQDDPEIYLALTAENNQWDLIEITKLLEGWVNGDFLNNGMGIRGQRIDGSYDYRASNFTGTTPSYYSSRSTNPNKPRIFLQYIPAASFGKWSFKIVSTADSRGWAINTTDPHSGAGSLRLKDWSKYSYDEQQAYMPSVTLETAHELKAGKIETWFRLNSDSWPQLACYDGGYGCNPQGVEPAYPRVEYTTPEDNSLTIYFRYQDVSNHYKTILKPRGETSRVQRVYGGNTTTLYSWDSAFNAGDWKKIRIFWGLITPDDLFICGQMWNPYMERWRYLFSCHDVSPKFTDGGEVRLESYDADLDDTAISEELE